MAKKKNPVEQVCRECGCTWNSPCEDPDTGTCWWVLLKQKSKAINEMKKLYK